MELQKAAMREPNDDSARAAGARAGRRARHTRHRARWLAGARRGVTHSDYDIGLYYEADNPIDVGRLAKAAMLLPRCRFHRR
jgi:hypothetical protein